MGVLRLCVSSNLLSTAYTLDCTHLLRSRLMLSAQATYCKPLLSVTCSGSHSCGPNTNRCAMCPSPSHSAGYVYHALQTASVMLQDCVALAQPVRQPRCAGFTLSATSADSLAMIKAQLLLPSTRCWMPWTWYVICTMQTWVLPICMGTDIGP